MTRCLCFAFALVSAGCGSSQGWIRAAAPELDVSSRGVQTTWAFLFLLLQILAPCCATQGAGQLCHPRDSIPLSCTWLGFGLMKKSIKSCSIFFTPAMALSSAVAETKFIISPKHT